MSSGQQAPSQGTATTPSTRTARCAGALAPDGLENLSLVAAGLARGQPITKADIGGSSQWIDFPGPAGTVKTYSYSRVVPAKVVIQGGGPTPWKVISGDGMGTIVARAATKAGAEQRARQFNVSPDVFRNKVVVIGATASNLQDIHATSVDPAMSAPRSTPTRSRRRCMGSPCEAWARSGTWC